MPKTQRAITKQGSSIASNVYQESIWNVGRFCVKWRRLICWFLICCQLVVSSSFLEECILQAAYHRNLCYKIKETTEPYTAKVMSMTSISHDEMGSRHDLVLDKRLHNNHF